MIVAAAEIVEFAPSPVAGLVSAAVLTPASWIVRKAPEPLERGKYASFAGYIGFTALLVFAFLCTRTIEILSLVQADQFATPGAAQAEAGIASKVWSSLFLTLSVAHAALAGLLVVWLLFLILRASAVGARLKGHFTVRAAVFLTHAVVILMLGHFVSFYLV